jgi:hypothetical protein
MDTINIMDGSSSTDNKIITDVNCSSKISRKVSNNKRKSQQHAAAMSATSGQQQQ